MKFKSLFCFLFVTLNLLCKHTVLVPARINLEMAQYLFDTPDFKINYHHLYELSLIKRGKKQGNGFSVYGFHHDYLRIFEKKGLIAFKDIIQGPADSFSARAIINGKDHGLKSFFPPSWSHEKVIETIKMLCRERSAAHISKNSKNAHDVFVAKTQEGLSVQIVFDKKQSRVITAYPII